MIYAYRNLTNYVNLLDIYTTSLACLVMWLIPATLHGSDRVVEIRGPALCIYLSYNAQDGACTRAKDIGYRSLTLLKDSPGWPKFKASKYSYDIASLIWLDGKLNQF